MEIGCDCIEQINNPDSIVNEIIKNKIKEVIQEKVDNGELATGGSGSGGPGNNPGVGGETDINLQTPGLVIGGDIDAPEVELPGTYAAGVPLNISMKATPSTDATAIASFDVFLTGNEVQSVQANGNTAKLTQVIAEGTAVGTKLVFGCVAIDNSGKRSKRFVCELEINLEQPYPPNITLPAKDSPVDGNNLTWQLGPFALCAQAGVEDIHEASRYRVLDSNGNILFDSGELKGATQLLSYTTTEASIGSGNVVFQAAVKGKNLGWSKWANVCVRAMGVITPIMRSPINDAEIDRNYITLTCSNFATESGSADKHIASQWRIRSLSSQITYYDSGESNDLVRHVLINPPEGMSIGGTYMFDMRQKGEKLGWSDWSEPVSVRLAQFEEFATEMAFTTPGASSFTVPDDVTKVRVLCVGGGGGGTNGLVAGTVKTTVSKGGQAKGGSAGLGGAIVSAILTVVPGEVIPINVGGISSNGSFGTSKGVLKGGDSNFGERIIAGGGANETRGTSMLALGENDELICDLVQTPCSEYKSCNSFRDMSRNVWGYDVSYSGGSNGTAGTKGYDVYESKGGAAGNPGNPGIGSISNYGCGGDGGQGGNGGYGGYGARNAASIARANGGNGGSAGNGGNGGNGGGRGGSGGNGGLGGNGGNAYNTTTSGEYGTGGIGGRGGNGGTGGSGATGGTGGNGGRGGNGGDCYDANSGACGSSGAGGTGGMGGSGNMFGGNGGAGGTGGDGGTIKYVPNPKGSSVTGGQGGNGGNGGRAGYGGDGGAGGMGGIAGYVVNGGGHNGTLENTKAGNGGNGAPGGPGCVIVYF